MLAGLISLRKLRSLLISLKFYRETLNAGEIISNGQKEKGSYKEALQKSRWPPNELQSAPESSTNGDKDPLRRSLVSSFPDCDEIPSRNDVRKWAQNTWRGIHNIQSRRDAENVLAGRWSRSNHLLELDWWSLTMGAIPAQHQFDWFWVRILGLPLHLWTDKVMKEMGDQCGGWIEAEEETQLKYHLRWALIRVKGPLKEIPAYVEVSDGEFNFSLPVWCEAPARFRRKSDLMHVDQLEENSFFPSSNISEMEMGAGVRTETSFAKDYVAIYYGSEVLGGEDNNMPMVIYAIEGAGGNCSTEQITLFEDPLPLQINDGLSEQEIEDKASLWVHSNVLDLSQLFGVAFEGCDKVAFDLFLRIDQKRGGFEAKEGGDNTNQSKEHNPKGDKKFGISC
ncbi:hypothetical protein H5410_062091 [Solanum commersonii]|uniref:DUF4283 domain-containing protein n=1 Tax=Solanum commersonii TaxID=4109 RepID=A0A9J5W9R8_SOLCO|nr:hypothetical protein H5410_062091 [Solanum commersonii]